MPKGSIAFNASIITIQRVFTALLGIITTPIILNVLGVKDYGLYILLVGFVGMLEFANWSLSITTQRYVAFALGEQSEENQKKAFNCSITIHLVYAVIIFLVIATLGVLLLDSLLDIPEGRADDSKLLLIIVAVLSLVSIINVPYQGVLKAYENFVLYSALSLGSSVLKLLLVLLLLILPHSYDTLLIFVSSLLFISIIILLVTAFSTTYLYPVSKLNLRVLHWGLIKEMLAFIGWNLLGSLAILSRNQGISVVLNIFFGVIKNAAYGIAMQVTAAIGLLTQGISGAIIPKILKDGGSGNEDRMIYMMGLMPKLSILFAFFFAIPFTANTDYILTIWLSIVPENAVIFSQLIVFFSLSTSFSSGLHTVFNAIGRVKEYNIWVSLVLIMNLPVSLLFFKIGYPAYSILIVAICSEWIALFIRLFLLKKYLQFSILNFLINAVFKSTLPGVLTLLIVFSFNRAFSSSFAFLLVSLLVTFLIFPVIVYFMSLNTTERELVKKLGANFLSIFK